MREPALEPLGNVISCSSVLAVAQASANQRTLVIPRSHISKDCPIKRAAAHIQYCIVVLEDLTCMRDAGRHEVLVKD